MTDGAGPAYRDSFLYDLAKASGIRLAVALAEELRPHGVTAVALMSDPDVLSHTARRKITASGT